ncbi:hypothetical protein DPMN_029629 [Dreissena polymorpha]|uniref:Uncharacterized protein n=1 Tax=Dreissena polymorpha TaxID=45954 RepID=A0A9D4RFM2_DREPO|nr:hypothetical protein DPMN_029629 [Dreissena polymorpha]
MPTTRICLSVEYLSVSTSLVVAVLNSSTSELQLVALSEQFYAEETGRGISSNFLM